MTRAVSAPAALPSGHKSLGGHSCWAALDAECATDRGHRGGRKCTKWLKVDVVQPEMMRVQLICTVINKADAIEQLPTDSKTGQRRQVGAETSSSPLPKGTRNRSHAQAEGSSRVSKIPPNCDVRGEPPLPGSPMPSHGALALTRRGCSSLQGTDDHPRFDTGSTAVCHSVTRGCVQMTTVTSSTDRATFRAVRLTGAKERLRGGRPRTAPCHELAAGFAHATAQCSIFVLNMDGKIFTSFAKSTLMSLHRK